MFCHNFPSFFYYFVQFVIRVFLASDDLGATRKGAFIPRVAWRAASPLWMGLGGGTPNVGPSKLTAMSEEGVATFRALSGRWCAYFIWNMCEAYT